MKPNFALSLSFDGLRLMHRVEGGWHLVGQVALDDPDLTGALGRLRAAAAGLDDAPIATKLLIPNDQIRYLALDTTRSQEHDVVAALDGATPYPVSDLVYDYAKGGGRTYIAAVARETLTEANAFASEHGFNPVSFAAVPEPFTYVGEAFFGATEGNTAEREAEAVIVIGQADVIIEQPEPIEPVQGVEPVEDVVSVPKIEDDLQEPDFEQEIPSDVDIDTHTETQTTTDASMSEGAADEQVDQTPVPEVDDVEPDTADAVATGTEETEQDIDADQPEFTAHPPPPVMQNDQTPEMEAEPDQPASEISDDRVEDITSAETEDADTPAPLFASLRADRSEGQPTTPMDAVANDTVAGPEEPIFGRRTPPALAVPTGQGTDPMPAVVAPSRDDIGETAAPVTSPVVEDLPDVDVAPAITGEAPSALSPEAAIAAASLAMATDDTGNDADIDETSDTGGTAKGVTGAVGGMFASRRMARAKAKTQTAEKATTKPDGKSNRTVFGARKPKAKPVVGGKPKFLGLILTAVLLLFLLAIAAFAALSDDTIARWLGFGSADDTQIAASETPLVVAPEPVPEPVPETISPDVLATPIAPTGGRILTPEEAQRVYAATGVWQRAPRIPQIPRTTSLDELQVASAVTPIVRVPASPLADASSVAGDAVIATPVDPPPPSATFNYGTDGLVVATPEGAPTPDGVLIIAGTPPLNPPTRPGTIAPEITPQDQLAAVIPDEAITIPDAPAGVIVISGRPAIEPPARTGTVAPVATPAIQTVQNGDAPLVASDGLLVLAGTPPVLPPIRPGTAAPVALPPQPTIVAPTEIEPAEVPSVAPEADPTDVNSGVNIIVGAPPLLPPARPGTTAPASTPAAATQPNLDGLSADIASALGTTTAQTPTANTARPLPRPASVTQAVAAQVNAPTLGALSATQAAAFRPQTRPAGLAPVPVEPTPEVQVAVPASAPAGLQIAPEIAAAVQAAANRPDPVFNPTAQAVAFSERPDTRPRNMARIVARAQAAQERTATQVAAVAPRTVTPSGPTAGSVAQNATLENAINLRDVNLIGIYGGSSDRRALVRLGNGRFLRLTVGDRLDGGRVTAIGENGLSYTKSGRAITLEVPG